MYGVAVVFVCRVRKMAVVCDCEGCVLCRVAVVCVELIVCGPKGS